jgi:hypothetical protein
MAERPQIKPNAILGAIIFALVITLLYFFYPQIELLLPINGQIVEINSNINPVGIEQQCKSAVTVVTAKIGDKSKNHIIGDTSFGQNFVVYSEVTIKVLDTLKGSPELKEDNTMLTYELGGSVLMDESGHKAKYTYVYANSAKLDKDSIVMLFLDDDKNIISEKYGVLLKKDDSFFYDYAGQKYTIEQIQGYLG